MQMMYDIVARELKAMHVDSHPQHYLNFYCLGNREDISEESLGDDANMVIALMEISFLLF
jgi:hypothetical protein